MESWTTYLGRALLCKCPACGKGKLFERYLKQVASCAHCHEDLSMIRAEDGPAWLTIFIVPHLLMPFFFAFDSHLGLPEWGSMVLWAVLAFVLVLSLLPLSKAIFIAVLWRLKMKKSL